ncbi:MAG TPA: glycosyltransferase [Chthoniobacterales bacterium]|nr:glycosyltransferase [Chthoniobacterales bacterium]
MLTVLKKIIGCKSTFSPVRLVPQGASLGTVVISYITWPFCEGSNSLKARGHTNAFEVVAMAEAYQELGYTVEIVDYNNNDYLPPRDCHVAIDLHGQLERWNAFLPENCHRILHATGAHWLLANQSELMRLAAIRDRRGVVLFPRRQVEPSRSAALADHIVVLGNDYTIDSFNPTFAIGDGDLSQYTRSQINQPTAYSLQPTASIRPIGRIVTKPITRIPISSAYEFAWPEERDFSLAKKKFLWIGSYGMVHKGLDLVLEAFSQMPELSLTVCGRPEKEDDFYKLYEKELLHTPNIHFLGWIDMASPEFLEIAATHAAIVYPSCSEGGGGSVIHCMHAGMVPLCTKEASVDLGDFGMQIKGGSVEDVIESVQSFSALSDQEVAERARSSYDHVRRYHTRDQFRKNYQNFAARLTRIFHTHRYET